MKRLLGNVLASLFGRTTDRRRHRKLVRSIPSVSEAITSIQSRWGIPSLASERKPIFIFSAGWRSGSTLLQRLVVSDSKILIWGEPFAHCDLVRKLADGLRTLGPSIPPEQFFINHYVKDSEVGPRLRDTWVANLYPMPLDLLLAHRALFKQLYEQPALEMSYLRWGFKEVRLSGEYARYLKLLFPDAKFLFLYRNPYDAYRSYKSFRAWYDTWPDKPIFTPRQFGTLWQRLGASFLEAQSDVGAKLVRFEELASGATDFGDLARYLEVDIDTRVIDKKATGTRAKELGELTTIERLLLRAAVNPLAKELGY